VLSDIQLIGEATGLDLAERVNRKLPCILMTSLPTAHEMFLTAQPLAPVLQTPFTAADLAALITPNEVAAE